MKPSVRNKKGQPLLLFRRILIGRTETLPLHITNDGTLPSKVDIDCVDPDASFTLRPVGDTQAVMATAGIHIHVVKYVMLCYYKIGHNSLLILLLCYDCFILTLIKRKSYSCRN